MKNILIDFYAVTVNSEVWRSNIYGVCDIKTRETIYKLIVKKIAQNGIPLQRDVQLKNGPFLAVSALGLARFFPRKKATNFDSEIKAKNIEIEEGGLLEIPFYDEKKDDFVTEETKPIAAIFFTEKEAAVCSRSNRLEKCDIRWESETEEVISEIGLDHPVFAISKDRKLTFPGSHFLECESDRRKQFPESDPIPAGSLLTEKEVIKKTSPKIKKVKKPKKARSKKFKTKESYLDIMDVLESTPAEQQIPMTESVEPVGTAETSKSIILIPPPSDSTTEWVGKKILFETKNKDGITLVNTVSSIHLNPNQTYELVEVKIRGVHFYVHKQRYLEENICYGKLTEELKILCEVVETEKVINLTHK